MSLVGAHSEVQLSPALESSRDKFYRLLFHDDKDGNFVLFTRGGGAYSSTTLNADALSSYQFDANSNYYITHNSFYGYRRLSLRTKQLNALFFDIDCHKEPSQAKREILISLIQERLAEAVVEERLPMPTIIVDSGRGIQLYYVLRRSIPYQLRKDGVSSEKGVKFYEDVQRRLADVIEEQMEDLDLVEIDRSIFDHSRVGRIPDTFNTKAGRYARLVNACEVFYDLPVLATYRPAKKESEPLSKTPKRGKSAFFIKFDALLMSRLNKIAELQEYRNYECEGNRELMCFVYYNTAVQVYDREDAANRLLAFNGMFRKPLPKQELKGIIASVDRVTNVKGERGHYVLNARTIVEYLGLTEKEMEATGFFMSKRAAERLRAKKATKEKKEARNKRIIELRQNDNATQEQIANEVGCSVRTVRSVLKEAGLARIRAQKKARETFRNSINLKEAAKSLLESYALAPSKSQDKIFSTGKGNFLAYELRGSLHIGLKSAFSPCYFALFAPLWRSHWLSSTLFSLCCLPQHPFGFRKIGVAFNSLADWLSALPHRSSLNNEERWGVLSSC